MGKFMVCTSTAVKLTCIVVGWVVFCEVHSHIQQCQYRINSLPKLSHMFCSENKKSCNSRLPLRSVCHHVTLYCPSSPGHGLNVTTSFGRVRIEDTDFHDNRGNGLYVRTVDKIYRRWEWRSGDFCTRPPASSFPQLYTGTAPSGNTRCPKVCECSNRDFTTCVIVVGCSLMYHFKFV